MKKILAMMLCTVMTLSIVACGAEKEATKTQNTEATNEMNSVNADIVSTDTIMNDNSADNDEQSISDLTMSFEISGDGKYLMVLEGDCLVNFSGTWLWIKLYDETGKGGICMSLSPDRWNLSHIVDDKIYYEYFQDEPLVTDLKSSIWTIEVMHDDFIQAVENCSSYEVIYKDFNNDDNTRTVLNGSGSFVFSVRSSDSNANELSVDNQTNSYSQLIGTWEEDSDLTYRARYTFYEDGKVKVEYTEAEGADCGENAKFDGVNATWAWTTGDLAGFGGALGPMEGFDGNSFTIPAANAYEEAKRFIKTN